MPADLRHLRGAAPEIIALHAARLDDLTFARLDAQGLTRDYAVQLTDEEFGLTIRELEHALDTVPACEILERLSRLAFEELTRAAALAATSGMSFARCLESVTWELDECPELRWQLKDDEDDGRVITICRDLLPLPRSRCPRRAVFPARGAGKGK